MSRQRIIVAYGNGRAPMIMENINDLWVRLSEYLDTVRQQPHQTVSVDSIVSNLSDEPLAEEFIWNLTAMLDYIRENPKNTGIVCSTL